VGLGSGVLLSVGAPSVDASCSGYRGCHYRKDTII
jgi:hypothetical protein